MLSHLKLWLLVHSTSAQCRYVVPDVPEALKQRIQREAFICNELTIREEEPSLDDEEQEEDLIVEEDLL